MNDAIGYILLTLMLVGPLILIPAIFFLGRFFEKKLAGAGKLISISWLVGIISLLPGLTYVTKYLNHGGLDISLETTDATRGWPFGWLGFNGLGNLFVPLYILGDIVAVALPFALAAVILALLPIRWNDNSGAKSSVFLILVLVFVLLPLWGGPSISNLASNLYSDYKSAQQQKNLTITAQYEKQEVNSIQLQQCSDFTLVPSTEYPGIKNIQVSVLVKVNTPHYYEITASLRDPEQYSGYGAAADDTVNLQLGVGEQHLVFLLRPIETAINQPMIMFQQSGPYHVQVFVNTIRIEGWGDLDSGAFYYTQQYAGIINSNWRQNLILNCLSPAYTLDDLGVSTFPTPTP